MSDIDIVNSERTDEGDYPKNSDLCSGWVAIPTYSAAFRWFSTFLLGRQRQM